MLTNIDRLMNQKAGINLSMARKKAGISQEAVCARLNLLGLGTDRGRLANIEAGKIRLSASEMIALCEIYNIPYQYVYR